MSKAQQKHVNIGEGWRGGGLTDLSTGYEILLPPEKFQNEISSLLIRFIMITNGKYKIS